MSLLTNFFKHQKTAVDGEPEVCQRDNSVSWEHIPYTVLLQVAHLLNDTEKSTMAQVCKKWRAVVEDPSLWRGRGFVFGGPKVNAQGVRAVQFVKQHGRHLRHVNVECCYNPITVNESISTLLRRFLKFLGKARLLTFRVECADLCGRWESSAYRGKLATWFGNFLRTQQHGLKMFGVVYSLFRLEEGVRLVQHLSDVTSGSLQSLELVAYFAFGVAACQSPEYVLATKAFRNLVIVHMSYSCINEEILLEWARHETLSSLHLLVHRIDPHTHVIQNEAWKRVKSSCPQLIVLISIMDVYESVAILPILQPAMPLCRIVFKLPEFIPDGRGGILGVGLGQPMRRELELSHSLRHLVKHFKRTLQDLVLDLDNRQNDQLDAAILETVTDCQALRKLSVTAEVGERLLNELRRLKEQKNANFCHRRKSEQTFQLR